ncbi:Flp pilus assembly CpaF family ATPase [Ilumatobacter fluminis]|uniref:Flp pilus assembly CpaF family ATPase n=1 Tax=Ilumatobacter fluminis TaxID=467091 RepID=A0A4R7HUT7_9ACTN|nr:ATPase, T2SS/T4P/T4SS family [Ilumatobacter fluminis]TDT14692.1 Flp pilus assembly CpaF family ATPase [Ilumatobacter fluminis]
MTTIDSAEERAALVRFVTDRVAGRLVEAIEADEHDGAERNGSTPALSGDARRQQLLVGSWLSEEIAQVNQDRLRRGASPLSEMADRDIRARVVAELTGTGPLEPYMTDPSVEEIDVNSHTSTWVTYTDGRKVDVGALWESPASLTAYQKRLARRMTGTGEGRLDTQSPMLTFQADDGSRVVMVLGGRSEHGVSTHPRIAIRRFVLQREGLGGLASRGMFPTGMVSQLEAMVRCGFTILVSGPPGAGKTTLLTELLGAVSPRERIITVEKNLLELKLEDDPRHPDAPALYTRHANAEGEGEITTRQLVELTRRLNPDRVVVGELVEDEALDMLDVASMCKRGSLATIHAHTSDVVVQRLAYYVSKSNTSLPEFAVWSLIAQTVDFIVHIDLVRNEADDDAVPQRRVTSIIEIGGLGERGGLATTEVWSIGDSGRLTQVAPLSTRHLQRLRLAGYDPRSFAPGSGPS